MTTERVRYFLAIATARDDALRGTNFAQACANASQKFDIPAPYIALRAGEACVGSLRANLSRAQDKLEDAREMNKKAKRQDIEEVGDAD